jgi:hypothetical protein
MDSSASRKPGIADRRVVSSRAHGTSGRRVARDVHAAAECEQSSASSACAERIVIADVLRDRDEDGWTDLEEIRLGINPNSADTDGDVCPTAATFAPAMLRQAAKGLTRTPRFCAARIFAHLGLPGSPWVLLVDATSRKLQLTGFGGPVIFDRAIARRGEPAGGVYVRWQFTTRTADQATYP